MLARGEERFYILEIGFPQHGGSSPTGRRYDCRTRPRGLAACGETRRCRDRQDRSRSLHWLPWRWANAGNVRGNRRCGWPTRTCHGVSATRSTSVSIACSTRRASMPSSRSSARSSTRTASAGRAWRRAATSACCCSATSKGLESERAMAWRAADSLSLRQFLDIALHEAKTARRLRADIGDRLVLACSDLPRSHAPHDVESPPLVGGRPGPSPRPSTPPRPRFAIVRAAVAADRGRLRPPSASPSTAAELDTYRQPHDAGLAAPAPVSAQARSKSR